MNPSEAHGRIVAAFWAKVTPALFADLTGSDLLPRDGEPPVLRRAAREWESYALYACVRGLVASGGFNQETALAIDALHDAALDGWNETEHDGETALERRQLVSDRYAEYGAIGESGGASGAATVGRRMGEAAAVHVIDAPKPELAAWLGAMHEAIAEGVVEILRRAESSG